MAYAFEKILSQVDPNKINLFAGQAGGAQPEIAGTQAPETKTETGGAVGTGDGAGAQVQSASIPSEGTAGRSVGTQRAFEASQKAGPVSVSAPMGRVAEKLATAQKGLQEEADKYKTTELGKQQYEVGTEDIQKAVAGDREAGAKVSGTMGRTTVTPVAQWTPQTKYEVSDIEKFKSTPGISRYLHQTLGPGYTAGASALDVQRIRSSPEFQRDLAALEAEQARISDIAKGYAAQDTGLQASVTKTGQERLAAAKKGIEGVLGSEKGALEAQQEAEYQKYLQDVAEAGKAGSAKQKEIAASKQGEVQKRFEEVFAQRPELKKYMTPEAIAAFGISPEQFVKQAETKGLSAQSFYDPKEAERFNRIMQFLGGTEARVAGEIPQTAGELATEEYLQSVVGRAGQANEAADVAARQAIAQARARAEARGAQARSQVTDPNVLAQRAAQARASLGRGDIAQDIVDASQFYRPGEVSGSAMDYLDPADVAAMNAAYEELMTPQNVQAGRLFNAPAYTFDEQAYKNAVLQRLNALAVPTGGPGMPAAIPGGTAIYLPDGYNPPPGPPPPTSFGEQILENLTNPFRKPLPAVPKKIRF